MKQFTTLFILGFAFSLPIFSFAQHGDNITGSVYEMDKNNQKVPLTGANVFWLGTIKGTTSDVKGNFSLSKKGITNFKMVISFLGYTSDTIAINPSETHLDIKMSTGNKALNGVVITGDMGSSYISKLNARTVQVVTTAELYRAACCNLSESFETNASVDVSYSDALTGAKQIQLLGLSGIYSQIQTENIPSIRGMASAYGLNYIPGSWMESIQISKGTSSVINGYESITGQINVEYKKPATSDRLFVNVYANSNQRLEANFNTSYQFNDKLSTMVLFHWDDFRNKINNIDSTTINLNGEKVKLHENFMDLPLVKTINLFNRWDYINKGKYVSRFGIKYLEEQRNGGTMDYDKNSFVLDTARINNKTLPYGFELNTTRAEAFWKNGIMFPSKPYQSLGLILSGINHQQSGFFGVNNYHGSEQSVYANLIFQSIIGNTDHKYSTGLSYIYDDYKEGYDQTQFRYIYQDIAAQFPDSAASMSQVVTLSSNPMKNVVYNWNRREIVPGAFFEYTYNYLTKFSAIIGIRADYHNTYGAFVTPRANIRYQVDSNLVIRASAGLGYRTANIISENLYLLASQRNFVVVEPLKQEKAANYGINITKDFKLFKNKAELSLDVYRTDFLSQVVVDLDSTPTTAYFYNLKGKSYSNSYQIQLTMEPIKRLSVLMAFRVNDAKETINNKLVDRLLLNKYKGLITLSYATKFDKWKFDVTSQFNGSARISPQDKMPLIVRKDYNSSPQYYIVNAQITKKFKRFVDVYLGVENLLNFVQTDPITEPFIPYHTHFDTSMVWGPIVGRVIYGGMRFALK